MFKPKKIIYGEEVTKKLTEGARKVYEAVTTTMGPAGNLVCFEHPSRIYPTATKDGVSVASMINLADPFEDMAAQLMIEGARTQLHTSGDGTTLTILLTYVAYCEGLKIKNKSELKHIMQEETESIIKQLKDQAIPVDAEKIQDIATISTNGNKELGKLIADAIIKVGEHGIVKSGKSYTSNNEVEHSSGYSIAKGIKYAEFFTEVDALNYENCNIVVTDQNINWATDLRALAEIVDKQPTIIFAPYVGDEALGSLRASCAKSGFHIAIIEPESIGESQKFELNDISSLTGATFLERDSGVNFKDIKKEHIGKASRVHSVYSKQSTIIYQHKRPNGFFERTKALQSMLSEENQALKDRAKTSLAKLTGGVAVIKIAATTDTEQKEIIDRVDDAILACRSAQEMGIVDGGGCALWCCDVDTDMFEEIVLAPRRKILSNAGIDIDDDETGDGGPAYNISTGTVIKSMSAIGVIDPVKVIITALQNAVSIAGVLLNTTCLICEEDTKRGIDNAQTN